MAEMEIAMNGINNEIRNGIKRVITEQDIEQMCQLAEDIVGELQMNYRNYDDAGNATFTLYASERDNSDTEAEYDISININEPVENEYLLSSLLRSGLDIGDVRYYTVEDILKMVAPIVDKAVNMFRKGTIEGGDTDYVVDDGVSDDYLKAVFAREVRNLMMIYAGQKMQRESITKYLLVLECPMCHDGDEWIGIYFDDDRLKRAYDRVSSQLERLIQVDNSYRSYEVAIYEFTNYEDGENKGDSLYVDDEYMDGEYIDYGYGIKPGQAIRRIKKSELDCFN